MSTKVASHELDRRIAKTVRALMTWREISHEDLQHALGMSRATWYTRMNGSSEWRAHEVRAAADALQVPVQLLFDGLGALTANPTRAGDTRLSDRVGVAPIAQLAELRTFNPKSALAAAEASTLAALVATRGVSILSRVPLRR